MSESLDLKNVAENAVSSYETRIESVGAIFDTTHQILMTFKRPLLVIKKRGEKLALSYVTSLLITNI